MFRSAILIIFLTLLLPSEGSHWQYGETGYGPHDWNKVSAHCSKSAQSPININSESAQNDPGLVGLDFTCDNNNGKVSGNLVNNGHAPTMSINKSRGTASLTGGPLGKSVFKFQQLHFHFGCDDNKGSEHTVNGKAFSGELHLVTYNTKYPDFKTAADKPDGLSVIGLFFKANDDDDDDDIANRELNELSRKLRQIKEAGNSIRVNNLNLYKLVPGLNDLSKASFFYYKGSLTTPPCYQSVSWIVLKYPINASEETLENMRHLHDHEEHKICNNFRPTQPLNDRSVSAYSA